LWHAFGFSGLETISFENQTGRIAQFMKRRILDIDDCSDSPMLAKSKSTHWGCKACWADACTAHSKYKPAKSSKIQGLTSDFFAGISPSSKLTDGRIRPR
jgi:hypothetical protein